MKLSWGDCLKMRRWNYDNQPHVKHCQHWETVGNWNPVSINEGF